MFYILGLLPESEIQNYHLSELTNHAKSREFRLNLVSSTNVLYYFEVYRQKDKSRQIHCLLDDSTVVIFNKKSKKVITAILADQDLLHKYINKCELDEDVRLILNRCSTLNKKYRVNDSRLDDDIAGEYIKKKKAVMKGM